MNTPIKTAEKIVQKIIDDTESMMPKCYTEEAYKIVLANKISDKHIEILKNKSQEQKIESTLDETEKIPRGIGGPGL